MPCSAAATAEPGAGTVIGMKPVAGSDHSGSCAGLGSESWSGSGSGSRSGVSGGRCDTAPLLSEHTDSTSPCCVASPVTLAALARSSRWWCCATGAVVSAVAALDGSCPDSCASFAYMDIYVRGQDAAGHVPRLTNLCGLEGIGQRAPPAGGRALNRTHGLVALVLQLAWTCRPGPVRATGPKPRP
jgi:hypothetical protein